MSTMIKRGLSCLLVALAAVLLILMDVGSVLAVGDALLYLGSAIFTVFIVTYHIFTQGDWKRHYSGRNIMLMMVCTDLLLLLNTSYNVFGSWWLDLRPYARALVYLALAVVAGQRCVWLWREQWPVFVVRRQLAKHMKGRANGSN